MFDAQLQGDDHRATRRRQAHHVGATGNVERLKNLYRRRRDVMLEALEEHFGEHATWTRPQGGMFIWATLDERIDTTDLLALARKSEGVAFVPGRAASWTDAAAHPRCA